MVLVIPFINSTESSRDLTIFITSFISSFDIISVLIPDTRISFKILAPAAGTTAVNPFTTLLHFWLTAKVRVSSINQLSLMVQEVYQGIYLAIILGS